MSIYKIFHIIIFITLCVLMTTITVSAQTNEEPVTRSINSVDFRSQRTTSGVSKGSVKSPVTNQKRRKSIDILTSAKRNYRWVKRTTAQKKQATQPKRANPKIKLSPLVEESLGVTFWRLRPLKSEEKEDAPTFAVNTGDGTDYWTAERVRSTTRFKIDDLIRFTIEASRRGFLYIINREVYNDGSTGEAKMVYPTLKSKGRGNNTVSAGSLVDAPSGKGYFRLQSGRNDYAGEEIIVVISPTKLPAVKLEFTELPIADEKLEKWIADWGEVVDIFDATDGEGTAITRTENEAVNTRSLVPEEPLPQTIYKTKTRSNQPLLITFQLLARQQKD